MRHHRLPWFLTSLLLSGVFVMIAAAWWLATWVPTQGKAWIEAQMEQAYPVEVTIARLRYGWWEGVVFDGVRVVERRSLTPWFDSPRFTGRVSLIHLALTRQVRFRLAGDVTVPLTGPLAITGTADLRTHALRVEFQTGDVELDRLSPVLAQRLPPELTRGTVRVTARLDRVPEAEPALTLHVIGQHLLWTNDTLRVETDAVADGRLTPAEGSLPPWAGRMTLTLDHGSIDGVPVLDAVRQLSGVIEVEPDTLRITTLHGTALDSPFTLEGALTRRADPAAPENREWYADLLVNTKLDAARLSATLPAGVHAWQPAGEVDLTLRGHGPLRQWRHGELMAEAKLRDAAFTAPHVTERFEHLDGVLAYDHAPRRLEVRSLSGRLGQAEISTAGWVVLTTPPLLNLTGRLQGDASVIRALGAVTAAWPAVSGPVSAQITARGSPPGIDWQADVTIADGAIAWTGFPGPVTHLTGRFIATNDTLATERLSCTLRERSVALRGRITELRAVPRLALQADWPEGSAVLKGAWQPDALAIDSLDLSVGGSYMRAVGSVGRTAAVPSRLVLTGTVDLKSLEQIPGLPRAWLEAWQPDGLVAVQLRAQGSWAAWREIELSGVLQAEEIRLRAVPLRQMLVELQQQQRTLSIRLLRSALAGGRLAGQYILKDGEHPQYLLDLDLTKSDLAQLAAAVPAWRDRPMQGEVSASAHLINLGPTRATMTGNGWVHAVGELGNLPLLDRLMRGIFGVLADRLGFSAFRTAAITDVAGQWTLAQERVVTDDLRLGGVSGAEPISIYLHGSIGLDKTLDLTVEPELSDQLVLQSPGTTSVAGTMLKTVGGLERLRRMVGRHHVGGTLDDPHYQFQFSLDQLLSQSLPSGLGQLLDSLR